MSTPLTALAGTASTAIRNYQTTRNAAELRTAAEAMVKARAHFLTQDGQPDTTGRTGAYRKWAADVVSAAGVQPPDRNRLLSAIRYHAGNVHRDTLRPEELAARGLTATSAAARSKARHARNAAALKLVSASESITDPAQLLDAAKALHAGLVKLEPQQPNPELADILETIALTALTVAKTAR